MIDGTAHDDFLLEDLMTVDQVVERFPILIRSELQSAMRQRALRHWAKGRQRYVTERWLQDWIRSQLRGGEDNANWGRVGPDEADRRGWDGPPVRKMTPEQEQIAAEYLAQYISRKPRKPARRIR